LTATEVPSQRKMYHTQEHRLLRLSEPKQCEEKHAWLGKGYYYWDEHEDAIRWGNNSKKRTGRFEIYLSFINCENVLDTVFNEKEYRFWLTQVEKVAKNWIKKTNEKLSPEELNDCFRERATWNEVAGIMFQDLPRNPDYLLVTDFHYKKRIQLVVFDKKIIMTFDFLDVYTCS
jgi:hypothetical protein